MTLKDKLFQQFNIDLPISGAEGDSIDAPIILHREGINDFVGLELTLIKYLMLKQGVEWKKHGQSIVKYKDRLIDEVKIEVRKESGDRVVSFIDKFYFDITACIDLEWKEDNYFDENEGL